MARPVRKAPPTSIKDMRFPEIIPFQEAIPEETAEDELSAAPSDDKGGSALKKKQCYKVFGHVGAV